MIDLEHWQTQHWYKSENRRFYRVELHQDLFGNWLLTRTWGSAYKLGRQVSECLDSWEDGLIVLQRIRKQRAAKHYQPQPEKRA